jgi:hypothetical protein
VGRPHKKLRKKTKKNKNYSPSAFYWHLGKSLFPECLTYESRGIEAHPSSPAQIIPGPPHPCGPSTGPPPWNPNYLSPSPSLPAQPVPFSPPHPRRRSRPARLFGHLASSGHFASSRSLHLSPPPPPPACGSTGASLPPAGAVAPPPSSPLRSPLTLWRGAAAGRGAAAADPAPLRLDL